MIKTDLLPQKAVVKRTGAGAVNQALAGFAYQLGDLTPGDSSAANACLRVWQQSDQNNEDREVL